LWNVKLLYSINFDTKKNENRSISQDIQKKNGENERKAMEAIIFPVLKDSLNVFLNFSFFFFYYFI
jgi:hypothetical protein